MAWSEEEDTLCTCCKISYLRLQQADIDERWRECSKCQQWWCPECCPAETMKYHILYCEDGGDADEGDVEGMEESDDEKTPEKKKRRSLTDSGPTPKRSMTVSGVGGKRGKERFKG